MRIMRPGDRKEAQAKILTSRMKEAGSATEFIGVLEEALEGKAFNAFLASVAYHSLATWQRKGRLQANDFEKRLFLKLNGTFQAILAKGQVDATSFVKVLWSVAHLSKALPGFLDVVPSLVVFFPVIASKLDARTASNSLWSAVTLKDAAPDVLKMIPALVAQIQLRKKANAQDVANNLWATATSKDAAPDVLKIVPTLTARVPVIAKDMKAQAVSNSLWAAAMLKDDAPDVLNIVPPLAAHVPVIAKDLNSQGVSNTFWAAATLKDAAPDVLKIMPALVAQIQLRKRANAQDVANNLWATATLKDAAPDVLKLVPTLTALFPMIAKDLNAQDVSSGLWSVAMLKEAAPDVLEAVPELLTNLHGTVQKMNAQKISNSLASLMLLQDAVSQVNTLLSPSRAGKGTIATDMIQRFETLLPNMTDTDWRVAVPTVVWVSAKLAVHRGELLESVSDHFGSQRTFSTLSDWAVCALRWSYTVLDSTEHFKGFGNRLDSVIHSRGLTESDVQDSQHGPLIFSATK